MLSTGDEPEPAALSEPVLSAAPTPLAEIDTDDADADAPAGSPDTAASGMSWWGRAWVSLGVLVAIGVTASGVVLVRHVLDRQVSRQSLLAQSTSRLAALAPSLAGFEVAGSVVSASVGCPQGTCASAALPLRATARTTGATLIAEADAWAALSGLGSPDGGDSRAIRCANVSYAPVSSVVCQLGDYAVPGQDAQRVRVYAELSATGKAASPGLFSLVQAGRLFVGASWVQVLTAPSSTS